MNKGDDTWAAWAMREGRWKLLIDTTGERSALYDLTTDRAEAMKARYEALGGKFTVKIVPGEGHKIGPSFFACPELVDFLRSVAK